MAVRPGFPSCARSGRGGARCMGGVLCGARGAGDRGPGGAGAAVVGEGGGVCEGYLRARVVRCRWRAHEASVGPPPPGRWFVKLFVVDAAGRRRAEGGKVRTEARAWDPEGTLTFSGAAAAEGATGPLWAGEGVGVVLGSPSSTAYERRDPVAHAVVAARGELGVGAREGSGMTVVRLEDGAGRHVADCEVDAGFIALDGVLEVEVLEGRRLGGAEPPVGPPRTLTVEASVCGATRRTQAAPIGHNPAGFPGGRMRFDVPRLADALTDDVVIGGNKGVALRVLDRGACLGTAVLPLRDSLRDTFRWMAVPAQPEGDDVLRYEGLAWLPLRDARGRADPETRGEVRVAWVLTLSHGGRDALDEELARDGRPRAQAESAREAVPEFLH